MPKVQHPRPIITAIHKQHSTSVAHRRLSQLVTAAAVSCLLGAFPGRAQLAPTSSAPNETQDLAGGQQPPPKPTSPPPTQQASAGVQPPVSQQPQPAGTQPAPPPPPPVAHLDIYGFAML